MRTNIYKLLSPAGLFVFLGMMLGGFAVSAGAQSTTAGAIAGTVFDSSGAVVSGASVKIVNTATNATVSLTTDSSGFFKAPLLSPGTYTVSFSSAGFGTFKAENTTVQVGQVTTLEPHLSVATTSSSVVVTEQTPALNMESPDLSDTLNGQALSSIPINNRRWSSLSMTTPGVVSDANGYGLVSIHGISPVLNNVEIDGADDNQAYYAEERGRTREAYSTAGSAVREFAVNTGVYSAEYGRAAGGVITSVTKSGTNELHGQAYFYDRESNWAAYNDYATESVLNPATGQYVSTHIKPEDLRKIYGFTAGGPLVKNRLFWMYTYDQHTHVFPGTAIPDNASQFYTLPTPSASFPAGVTASQCNLATGYFSASSTAGAANYDPNYTLDSQACTLAARQKYTNGAVSGYDQGVNAYDAGIAGLTSDLGNVSRFGYQEINTPKLDWQVNDRQHVELLYHRLRWDSPGGVQTSATDDYGRDTWGNDFVKLDYGLAKLTSLISPTVSNELLYQYGRELDDETQQPFTPYTQANLVGAGGSAGNVPEVAVDTAEGMYIGSPYYSYRKALPEEWKQQVGDILYDNIGNHSVRLGADLLHNQDEINNTYESNGDYVYSYIGNYINDLLNKGKSASTCNSSASSAATAPTSSSSGTAVGTDPCYADFYQGFGNPIYQIGTLDIGMFLQDNWKFRPRLTLELGLRWDAESIPPPDPNLTTAVGSWVPYTQLMNNPSDKKNFGPRVGFSWDIFGKGTTVLRGGYGIYYGRLNNGELLQTRLNTGSPNGQYTTTYKPTTAGGPLLPNIETGVGAAASTPTSNFLAANLRNPEVQEFDLSVQRALGKGTVLSVDYLGTLGRLLPNFLDVNLNPTETPLAITVSDASNKGPLGPNGTQYSVPQFTSYGNVGLFGSVATKYQAIQEMISNVNSNYNAAVVEVQNHSLHMIEFDANYTFSHALDYAQNADTTTTGGNSWFNPYTDARINYGNSNYNVPNRFVAYAIYTSPAIESGHWFKYLTNTWKIDDSFQVQNGLPYTVGVSGYFSTGILSDWNGGSGSTMLPMIGPNTMQYPRKMVDDARVEKDFALSERYNLQFMANIFNLANHQNIDGLGTVAYKLSGATATYQGQGTLGPNTYQVPTSSNNSGFLYTPREIEISTRLSF